MTKDATKLERALAGETRAALAAALEPRSPLGLGDIQKLHRRLREIADDATPTRIGIVHTYTSELLQPYLEFEASLNGLEGDIYHAPYGLTVQEATDGSGLARHDPDLTCLMLRWEDLDPVLAQPFAQLGGDDRAALASTVVDHVAHLLSAFRATVSGLVVLTLLPRHYPPGLGAYDAQAEASESQWRAGVKAELARRIRSELPAVHFLDLDEAVAEVGRRAFFDDRLWHAGRFPFTPAGAQEVARLLVSFAVVKKTPKAKVIVLDADNTLWGGIVGEAGLSGIKLGPEYPGSLFVDFQRRLLELQQRGFVLAMCSKNNPEDVAEVLAEHPHQVLKEEHFAAMRVNWQPKPQNLRELAEELNLGLDSFVFVDDSDHECFAVRQSLPMVRVVQTPARAVDVPRCLDALSRLEILSHTAEDRAKTQMYRQEQKRRAAAGSSTNVTEYLASLEMVMDVRFDADDQVPRAAQLTQKTNQFNLTTRRYTEADIRGFLESPDWLVAYFTLADIFGDSGVVGLALARRDDAIAEIDTFLMSCRVIGRGAETAFLNAVLDELGAGGATTVRASYLPTAKNPLVKDFYTEHGFRADSEGVYVLDLSNREGNWRAEVPIQVEVTGKAKA